MSSIIFTDEEKRYLRAVLNWQEKQSLEGSKRASWILNGLRLPDSQQPKPAAAAAAATTTTATAGELRVLVLGAKGVGKTSLLAKSFTGEFPDPSSLALLSHSSRRRRRHTITLDARPCTIDTLELPPTTDHHHHHHPRLARALAATDAALLVYDITDASSLTYLTGILRDALHHPRHPHHFLLLGTKADLAARRQVPWLAGQRAAAAAAAAVAFREVSARDDDCAVFPLLARAVLKGRQRQREPEPEPEPWCDEQDYHHHPCCCCSAGVADFGCCLECWTTTTTTTTDGSSGGGGGGGTFAQGAMRRRWGALKATLAGSILGGRKTVK